jgi:hypothetical protein
MKASEKIKEACEILFPIDPLRPEVGSALRREVSQVMENIYALGWKEAVEKAAKFAEKYVGEELLQPYGGRDLADEVRKLTPGEK